LNPLGLFLWLCTSILCMCYMEYSECLPTLLNPLAERTCFSQVGKLSEIFRTMGWDIRANASVKVRKTPSWPRSWANFSAV
jgi:hypothetical protein